MTKHILLFVGAFVLGALIALAARTATHDPQEPANHAEHTAAATPKLQTPNSQAETASAASNTVCAICGMDVDPKLPTLEYKGKKIGFGCRMCPPKFKADPDKYGPYYLRNEVMPK